ncbi:MAG TPA: nicotinate phosphoribosyltransferase [Acidimicrobiales bacterium]|nr:nicotinate phosphoribosyltransferase [Acidimicrobiales bacterium]
MTSSSELVTDLYELNMAATYLRHGMNDRATFSLFIRRLPPTRGFLVAAGLDDCLTFLENFGFDDTSLGYLRDIGFDAETIGALRRLRFTGDVFAVPEGTIVFADQPILEVTAPIAEAQLVETFLLNQITYQTAIASKAARCRLAARDRVQLSDFALRRAHGVEAGIAVARLSAMVGFAGTSNVEAARRFALRPVGTMAHSFIEAFPTELEAFRTFASEFPEATTFLVDTFDTLEGVRHAIQVIKELQLDRHVGIRLDSGDLDVLARAARGLLDAADLRDVTIFASGGLDEHDIDRFVRAGTPIDAVGVGTRLAVSADAPALDSAYKLVEYAGRPVRKLSPGKTTLPGAKQVHRSPTTFAGVLALRDDPIAPGYEAILTPVMVRGCRTTSADAALATARARFEADLAALPEASRRLDKPVPHQLRLSSRLRSLVDQLDRGDAS